MGCGSSHNVDESAYNKNKQINRYLKESSQPNISGNIRLMMLGHEQSGKTTFCQQLRVLYSEEPFSKDEKEVYRDLIHAKIVSALTGLCRKVLNSKSFELQGESKLRIMNFKEKYFNLSPSFSLTIHARKMGYSRTSYDDLRNPRPMFLMNEQMIKDILSLWKDPVIQESWQHTTLDSDELIPPILGYFMDHFHRITMVEEDEEKTISYIPTTEDILHCGLNTQIIEQFIFQIDDHTFDIYEFGGIKPRAPERDIFEHMANAALILYFLSMDTYGEDNSEGNVFASRLEHLDEFKKCKRFHNTKIILFLSKCDVFRKIIEDKPLSSVFPKFKGKDTYEGAIEFVKEKVRETVGERVVFVIETNCMDVGDVKYGFESVLGTLRHFTTIKPAVY